MKSAQRRRRPLSNSAGEGPGEGGSIGTAPEPPPGGRVHRGVTLAPRPFRIGNPGSRVAGLAAGRGPAVVLLHGLGSRAAEIAAPLLPLSARMRLVAVDRPGYGDSDPIADGPHGPAAQARRLRRALARIGVERPVLVAHSYGAAVALAWAMQAPERVAGLVFAAPFVAPTREAWMPLLRMMVAPVVGPLLRAAAVPWLGPRLARRRLPAAFAPNPVPFAALDLPVEGFATPAAVLAAGRDLTAYNADVTRLWTRLSGLAVPIEAVVGDADPVCDRNRHVEMLVRVAPDVRITMLRGVGHMPHHVVPGAVVRAVDRIAPSRREPGREFVLTSG